MFKRDSKFNNGPIQYQPPCKRICLNSISSLSIMMGNTSKKTSVSILQEVLCGRGITPSYNLIQTTGANHNLTFLYRVSFNMNDVLFTATGAGYSKQNAKQEAAKSLLMKHPQELVLCSSFMDSRVYKSSTNNEIANIEQCESDVDMATGNHVGLLHQLCAARKYPLPIYETISEIGIPHEMLFTISCKVLNYREDGQGKNKRIAKRIAAYKMWIRLMETEIIEEIEINLMDEEETEDAKNQRITNILNRYAGLKKTNQFPIATLKDHHRFAISKIPIQNNDKLMRSLEKSLEKFQISCEYKSNVDFVKLLEEIAIGHQFKLTYIDVSKERTKSGQYQCLVELSTIPVAVCHGYGKSSIEARNNAAQSGLEYLKIMLTNLK